MKRLLLLVIPCAIVIGGVSALFLYSFNRCGWGMLAYEYPFIAAFTGECAQQQRLMRPEEK